MAQTIPAKNLSQKIQDVGNSKIQSQGDLINDNVPNKYESTDKITQAQEIDKGIGKAGCVSNDGMTTNAASAGQNPQASSEQQ